MNVSDYKTNGFRTDLVEALAFRRSQLHSTQAYCCAMDQNNDFTFYSLEDLIGVKDPADLTQVENQAQLNSCGGHGGTSAFERAYEVETGARLQFSRMYLYIKGQNQDNIRDDSGMTISGGIRALTTGGCCLESSLPYTGKYFRNIPAACDQEAAQYKLGSVVDCTDAKDYSYVEKLLGHNMGAISNGCAWTNQMSECPGGIFEEWSVSGRPGGHATPLIALSERQDSKGRHYAWLPNSWGTRWGRGGFCEVSPDWVMGMWSHNFTESFGISKLVIPEKRKKVLRFDFS